MKVGKLGRVAFAHSGDFTPFYRSTNACFETLLGPRIPRGALVIYLAYHLNDASEPWRGLSQVIYEDTVGWFFGKVVELTEEEP